MQPNRPAPVLLIALLFSASVFVSNAQAQTRSNVRIRRTVPVRPTQVRPRVRSVQVRPAPVRSTRVRPTQTRSSQLRPSRTSSQTSSAPEPPPVIKDDIPSSALLTDRGSDLASRLRILRDSESRMGEKHPNYQSVQTEIKDIKRELTAWAPAEGFGDGDQSVAERLPSMNERDLKQLIVQLVGKIEQLEDRIDVLETPDEEE